MAFITVQPHILEDMVHALLHVVGIEAQGAWLAAIKLAGVSRCASGQPLGVGKRGCQSSLSSVCTFSWLQEGEGGWEHARDVNGALA